MPSTFTTNQQSRRFRPNSNRATVTETPPSRTGNKAKQNNININIITIINNNINSNPQQHDVQNAQPDCDSREFGGENEKPNSQAR